MRAINAVLYFDDSATAPSAGISVEIDGQPVLQRDDVPPADWIAVVETLGQAIDVDLRDQLSAPLAALVGQLQSAVEAGRQTQQERERALADWQAVTG